MPAKIGPQLKEALKARGLTQAALAERTNINREDINAIANDRLGVGPDRLQRIADALELTPIELDHSLDVEAAGAEYQSFRDRLDELATKLGDSLEQQRKLQQKVARLQARVRKLEDQSGGVAAAPKGLR